MAIKNSKNESSVVDVNGDLLNFAEWSEEQIGFAPYWAPEETEEGQDKPYFVGHIVARDERNPEMVTFLFQALQEVQCLRGPREERNVVNVAKGEYFSVSVYRGLEGTFIQYLESGINPPIYVQARNKSKVKSDPKRTFWNFTLKVPQNFKLQLDNYRRVNGLGTGMTMPITEVAEATKKRSLDA